MTPEGQARRLPTTNQYINLDKKIYPDLRCAQAFEELVEIAVPKAKSVPQRLNPDRREGITARLKPCP